MRFQTLLERISNPLRKQSLVGTPTNLQEYKDYIANFQDYVVYDDHVDEPELQEIKRKYLNMYKMFPARADAWLHKMGEQRARDLLLRSKLQPSYKKIYEYRGCEVFVDEEFLDSSEYAEGTLNNRMLKRSVQLMYMETKDLMPNRYPKFIITDRQQHKQFQKVGPSKGISFDKLIYIDQYYVDDYKVWIHELAHYMTERTPQQSRDALDRAYKELLDIYWKSAKKKRVNLDSLSEQDADRMRAKMAKKMNFPEYGFTDPDEFFAVLIENWKNLPNNRATYKYKTLVKNILSRLV